VEAAARPSGACRPALRLTRSAALGARHSVPTRRSSDLAELAGERGEVDAGAEVEVVVAGGDGHDVDQLRLRRPRLRHRRGTRSTDRKSTRLNSSHVKISYAVFCLKKKTITYHRHATRQT